MTALQVMACTATLGLSGGALADALRYDPAVLTGCLQDAALPDACIGMAADACMAAESAPDYGPIVAQCSSAEAQQWQGLIDTAYAALEAEVEALDPVAQANGHTLPGSRLQAMRQSWTDFRADALSFEEARWLGGSGEGPEVARRDMELTASHAIWLMRGAAMMEGAR